MHKKEDVFLEQSLKELRKRNFWPPKGNVKTRNFYIRAFITLLLSSNLWVGILFHFIIVLKDNLDVDISADISVLASEIGLHLMAFSFISRNKTLANLYRRLIDFSKFGKPANFDKMVHLLNFCSRMYSYYCIMGLTVYLIFRKVEVPECRRKNVEKGLSEICGLMAPIWTPFKADYFPVDQLILLAQLGSAYIVLNGGAALSFTTLEVACCIVLQIKHLRKLLTEVFDDDDDDIKRKKLSHCIKYHQHILQLQDMFDACYKQCNGGYVIMASVVIASCANQYMKEKNFGALIHGGAWVVSFFLCSHSGQTVLAESEKIANAAYASKWYEAPVHLQKTLLIVILRAQQPLYLHGSPIGIMSYELFLKLVKASTSYFALLSEST